MTDTGRIIWARTGDVIVREADGAGLEAGDLLVCGADDGRLVLQVISLEHGSQSDMRAHERMGGAGLSEERPQTTFYEPGYNDYKLAHAKPLAVVDSAGRLSRPKGIPPVFGTVRRATAGDLSFLPGPGPGLVFLGAVRSGSEVIEGTGLYVDTVDVFSHHILVPAATGRGKSNLIKCMLYGLLGTGGVGAMVLDVHGEYYRGLSTHPRARSNLVCYTGSRSGEPGQVQLRVNVRSITPHHLKGLTELSEAQERMMWSLWGKHKREWIIRLLDETGDGEVPELQKITRHVLRQRVSIELGLQTGETFDTGTAGGNTIREIARHVAEGRIVIIDTSGLGSSVELMIGSMAADRILREYQQADKRGELAGRPVATIIMEEVPRLLAGGLGGGNTFATIAREGRKFKVGLTAITQLSSIIPREIMANLGTKIILGNEMRLEREAIINSAAQDLSGDRDTIAFLDAGEAIVSSVFVPFAVPIRIPLFEDLARADRAARPRTKVY